MTARSRRLPPDFAIQSRRKQEDARKVFEEQTKSNRALHSTATWEVTTGVRIEKNMVRSKVETLRQGVIEDLDARRQRLAALLDEEDQQYQRELQGLQETTSQRADRLKARARELVRRREAERREFAKTQLTRQFRDNNDQFREIDSQRILEGCLASREEALEQIQQNKLKEKEDDQYWHEQWMGIRDQMIEREESDRARQHALREDMMRMLEKQLEELEAKRRAAVELKEEDARIMKEKFELDLEEARRKEDSRRQMYQTKKNEMNAENIRLRQEKDRKNAEERAEDLRLLDAMLEREKLAETREKAYRSRLSEQAKEYRRQLELLMQKELVSEAHAEAIRSAEQEKAFRKREMEWEREKEYREALMREVLAVRKQQLDEQMANNRQKRAEAMIERERMQSDLEDMARREKAVKEDRAFVRLEHSRELLAQIEENRRKLDHEKSMEEMERQATLRAEAQYQRAVELEMQTRRPVKTHGLKSSNWAT